MNGGFMNVPQGFRNLRDEREVPTAELIHELMRREKLVEFRAQEHVEPHLMRVHGPQYAEHAYQHMFKVMGAEIGKNRMGYTWEFVPSEDDGDFMSKASLNMSCYVLATHPMKER